MKKIKTRLCIISIAVLLLSSGCADKGSLGSSGTSENNSIQGEEMQAELIPITTVSDNFFKDVNALKAQEFDNISFDEACFTFPETTELHTMKYKITDYDIPPDNAYDFMSAKLDELFPNMFSDEDKKNEIRFFDVNPIGEDGQPIEEYPTLEQYKAMEKNYPYILGNHPTTGMNNEIECDLLIMNGVLREYDNGYLAKKIGYERQLGSFDVLGNFSVVYRTEDLESGKIFHLSSGDISIADAVKSAEKQLSEWEFSKRELSLELCVQNVNVLDIGDGCYAFYFGIVPEYKGLAYNCILPDNTVWGFGTIDDNTNEREACGEAIMCEADKLCRYRFINPASWYDIIENGDVYSTISLENAAKIASEYLTSGTSFKAISVSAVYKCFSEVDSLEVDYETYEKREINIRPCWRFVLQPRTNNTGRLYYIFVDMLTGKPYITVQQMESEINYD